MTGESYLSLWERIRKKLETLPIEEADRAELDNISKLLERAQKSEMALHEDGGLSQGLIVVNIHIPGVCTRE